MRGCALSAGSCGIALWAMTRAPVALVVALRETSILFAAAIALIACGAAAMRLA